MNLIPNIGNENWQSMVIIRDTGDDFTIELEFSSVSNAWYMSINDGSKIINKVRIVQGGNILHQFRNVLKFGISCSCDINTEPSFVDDFSTARASLYLLTQAECEAYTELISGQISA